MGFSAASPFSRFQSILHWTPHNQLVRMGERMNEEQVIAEMEKEEERIRVEIRFLRQKRHRIQLWLRGARAKLLGGVL
jgi:hypothetical protein